MPYPTPMQQVYDSGDFVKNLDDCLALGDHAGHSARCSGKSPWQVVHIGVATATAATGGRDYEHAEIRFDAASGVVLLTGAMDHGQGHATTFKQVLSEKHGIDADPLPLWRQRPHFAELAGCAPRANIASDPRRLWMVVLS
jgi:aerobic carbon-monoxide dehydrogenase large subunit